MDAFKDLISPITGPWTPLILVIAVVLIWAFKSLPGWISSLTGSVRGSTSSPRYWRARLEESLSHLKEVPDGVPERIELAARVTDARIMVEAHEARRRVGIQGSISYWVLVVIFIVASSLTWSSAVATSSTGGKIAAGVLTLFIFIFELLAIQASSVGTARLGVLVAAGRHGHSDLVRSDPWTVVRTYDIWASGFDQRDEWRTRVTGYKSKIRRGIRAQRLWFGPVYESGDFDIQTDIWAQAPKPSEASPAVNVLTPTTPPESADNEKSKS